MSELQIRGGTEENSKINFLNSQENIHCDPSLEPSRETVLMRGHNISFIGKLGKLFLNYPCYPSHL